MKRSDKILQDSLVQFNLLTKAEIQKHLSAAQAANETLKSYLLRNEIVSQKQILIALSQSLEMETVDFKSLKIDQNLIDQVPVKFAWYYKFMPVGLENNTLTIAVAFPIELRVQDEIRLHTGKEVKVVLANEGELNDALKKYYGFAADTIDNLLTKDPEKVAVETSTDQWIEDLERQTEDPTVSDLVNQIILEAYKKRATDIHIEPYRDKVRFRYRIDGALVDANLPENVRHFLPQILSRIKILANLSITERRLPQDGSAVVKTKDQNLDLRISTMPTPSGESMVIRILPTKVMLFSLEKLGFNPMSVEKFRYLVSKPHGIIFLTGPTGSGKTTTLYACLNEINSSARKIITIEDPVEYEMEGITQIQINSKVNFDFSTGLRSILRHDPDIIMVGEVRDLETAEIAIRTALTGHLVFSSLHTNDSASGVTRLIDMGVEPYLVASSVEAFVAQRLVRKICPKCKEEDTSPLVGIRKEIAASLNIKDLESIKIYKGAGCDHCNQTGYYDRMAIYEILMMNDAIRAAILEKSRSDHIKKVAMQEGLATLRKNGWKAVVDGITTPDEIMNVTVKDEAVDTSKATAPEPSEKTTDQPTDVPSTPHESRDEKFKRDAQWAAKNKYDSRIYPRTFDPIHIKYQIMRKDPSHPNGLKGEGIEFTTVTEDISARGLRFLSKELLSMGTILEVTIQLGEDAGEIKCLTKVCRVEENSLESIYSIATYYLDISSGDRVTVNNFVEKVNQARQQSLVTK